MDELIKELTLTVKTVRAYLEWRYKLEGGETTTVPAPVVAPETAPIAEEPAKPKAKRPAKAEEGRSVEEVLAQPGTEPVSKRVPPKRPAPGELSEKESLDLCYRLIADYLGKGDKEARADELRGYLNETFKKRNTSSLTHEERMTFATYLREMANEPAGV